MPTAERPCEGTDSQPAADDLSPIEFGWDGAARDHVTGALDELVDASAADVDAEDARAVMERKQQELVIETVAEAEALRAAVTVCQRRNDFASNHAQMLGSVSRVLSDLDQELDDQGYTAQVDNPLALFPRFEGYVRR